MRSRLSLIVSGLALGVALTGHLPTAVGDPLPDPAVPAGTIAAYAGGSVPAGWLPADGSDVSRVQYAALFQAIGTTYGSSGSTSFRLPDLRGRVAVGRGSDPSLDSVTDSDGLTETSRKLAHRHDRGTLGMSTAGSHTHAVQMTNGWQGGANAPRVSGWDNTSLVSWFQDTLSAGAHSHSLSGVVGGSGPMEGPAYGVVNYMIRY